MKNIIERIKFYFKKHDLYYKNGRGVMVDSYSLFTDTVCVRYSEFGYVAYYERMTRDKYLELIATYQ